MKLHEPACCAGVEMLDHLKRDPGNKRTVRVRPTPEWQAEQERKRNDWLASRHVYREKNPHISKDDLERMGVDTR